MSVIDRAFAKAYTRRNQPPAELPASSPLATGAAAAPAPQPLPPPSDLEVRPGGCAVLWTDPALDPQLRHDGAHPSAPAPQASAQPASAPPTPASAASTPTLQTAASQVPAAAAPAQPAPCDPIDLQLLCQSQLAYAAPLEPLEPLVDIAATPRQPTPHSPSAPQVASPQATARSQAPAPPRVEQLRSEIALTPFAAGWEVDSLEFPQCVRTLFADPALRNSIGLPLDRAVGEGLQTLLLTSERPGAGRTTVASGIAISAATAGLRVALVDANLASSNPASSNGGASLLADALNLQAQQGWLDAIRRGEPVSEAAVHSIEDQLTILPQVPPASGNGANGDGATAAEFACLIQSLRPAFDLIVIDGPGCHEPAFESLGAQSGGPIDAVILVQDMRAPAPATAARVMQTLANRGITGLGLVQNFS